MIMQFLFNLLTIMRILSTFLLFLILQSTNSQTNLVPNWSFEDIISCPQLELITFYSYTPPWFSPTGGTPDIYNICDCTKSNYDTLLCVPYTSCGYQLPHTGNGYAAFAWDYSNNCEYLSAKLISPLKAGKKYCISFFVNPGDCIFYVIDRIGLYLSIDSIHASTYAYLHYIPQIESPPGAIISDTVNWTEISGEYIATGGEQFITIGCFRPDSMVQLAYNDTIIGFWPYYYLDDVSVYYCGPDTTEYSNQFTVFNAFTPNRDGVNDYFKVHGQNIKTINGKIINRWGQELFKWSNVNEGWDGKYKGKDVSEGVYFYIISVTFEDGKVEEKHGSLELSR